MQNTNAKVTPTNDTNYSCYIKAIEPIKSITPVRINSIGYGHPHTLTHARMHTHSDVTEKCNFKNQSCALVLNQHLPGLKMFTMVDLAQQICTYCNLYILEIT